MSRSVRRGAVLLVLALSAAGAAVAGEVIHFNNGGVLAIQSHTVEGEMVRVTLGAGASLSFPLTLVKRIEAGGRTVYGGAPANVVPGGDRGAAAPLRDYPATGEGSIPSRFQGGAGEPGASAGAAYGMNGQTATPSDPSVGLAPSSPARAIGRLNSRGMPIGPSLTAAPGSPLPPTAVEGRPTLSRIQPAVRTPPPSTETAPEVPVAPEPAPAPAPVDDPPSDGGGE